MGSSVRRGVAAAWWPVWRIVDVFGPDAEPTPDARSVKLARYFAADGERASCQYIYDFSIRGCTPGQMYELQPLHQKLDLAQSSHS